MFVTTARVAPEKQMPHCLPLAPLRFLKEAAMSNQWLRLWHEMPTDPKWRTISRISGQPISLVQAAYVHLLVDASRNVTRGHATVTHEDLASALDVTDEDIQSILDAMQGRVLDGMKLLGWDKRQPKREDSGGENGGAKSAAQRKREQREREKASSEQTSGNDAVTQCHDESRNVTLDKDTEESYLEANASVASKLPTCQTDAVVNAYHENLPELPAVRLLNDSRRKAISAFWRWVLTSKKSNGDPRATDAQEALDWIVAYFRRASENDFLMGRHGSNGKHAQWKADFDFLLTEKGKRHVIEKTEVAA